MPYREERYARDYLYFHPPELYDLQSLRFDSHLKTRGNKDGAKQRQEQQQRM
jgi:hypothetical protein